MNPLSSHPNKCLPEAFDAVIHTLFIIKCLFSYSSCQCMPLFPEPLSVSRASSLVSLWSLSGLSLWCPPLFAEALSLIPALSSLVVCPPDLRLRTWINSSVCVNIRWCSCIEIRWSFPCFVCSLSARSVQCVCGVRAFIFLSLMSAANPAPLPGPKPLPRGGTPSEWRRPSVWTERVGDVNAGRRHRRPGNGPNV